MWRGARSYTGQGMQLTDWECGDEEAGRVSEGEEARLSRIECRKALREAGL